jgi:hypothetical protein
MAEDLGRDDRPVRITYHGEAGDLHAAVATPLAVVVTELLQNAAEHAWPDGPASPGGADPNGDGPHGEGWNGEGLTGEGSHAPRSGPDHWGAAAPAGGPVPNVPGGSFASSLPEGDQAADDRGSLAGRAVGAGTPPSEGRALLIDVELYRTPDELRLTVRDNGVGLPTGFSIDDTPSLGLSIVRGLVDTQMGGTITMRSDGGTVVDVVIPVDHPTDDLENL